MVILHILPKGLDVANIILDYYITQEGLKQILGKYKNMKYLVKCRLRGVGSSADSRKCGFEMQLFRATVNTKSFIEGLKDRFTHDLVVVDGKIQKRQGKILRPEECKVLIRDHHDGYIDWGSFEDNLKMIRDNNLNLGGDESVGEVRSGQGILCALLRCGWVHPPWSLWAAAICTVLGQEWY